MRNLPFPIWPVAAYEQENLRVPDGMHGGARGGDSGEMALKKPISPYFQEINGSKPQLFLNFSGGHDAP